ncbi:MAG: hypothetical protein ACYTGV_13395 [Planctomycetota bacterium]
MIPSLIGLGTKVATAVPGLKKPKKSDSGSRAARAAQREIARTAIGASQTGHGASRGLNLREGLRAAVDASKYSDSAAAAAQQDEAVYQEQLQARNERVASFGTDLAKGLGDMAGMGIGPKGADTPGTAAIGMGGNEGTAFDQAEQTLPTDQRPEDPGAFGSIQDGDLGVSADSIQADIEAANQKAMGAELNDPQIVGPTAAFQVDPTTQLIDAAPPRVMPEIEQALANKLHMKELALAEAERLGISLEVALPRLNRRFGLRPGQSTANPFGMIGTDFDETAGEE